jgi:hypothetical protein
MATTRRTYLVSAHEHDGPATVEEIRTGRKARIASLRDAGKQIERWLRERRDLEPEEGRQR